MPLPPVVVWANPTWRQRLVMQQGNIPQENQYFLEVQEGDKDAMGNTHWRPLNLTWDVFHTILGSVLAWAPLPPLPDEMK